MRKAVVLLMVLVLGFVFLAGAQPFKAVEKVKAKANERYIRALYRDIQGREGDPNGIAYWTGELDKGMPKEQVVLGFLKSEEYRTRFVRNLYGWFHDREPDPKGLKYWVEVMKEKDEHDIIKAFCITEEFWNNSNKNNRDFVVNLYWTLQSRKPEEKGAKFWLDQLNQGKTREFVVDVFIKSDEYRTKYITFVYEWCLHRQPDPKGLEFWKGQLVELGERGVVSKVLCGDEYWQNAMKQK